MKIEFIEEMPPASTTALVSHQEKEINMLKLEIKKLKKQIEDLGLIDLFVTREYLKDQLAEAEKSEVVMGENEEDPVVSSDFEEVSEYEDPKDPSKKFAVVKDKDGKLHAVDPIESSTVLAADEDEEPTDIDSEDPFENVTEEETSESDENSEEESTEEEFAEEVEEENNENMLEKINEEIKKNLLKVKEHEYLIGIPPISKQKNKKT